MIHPAREDVGVPPSRTDRWTPTDMPDQSGRTAVVTGANTGIGYETAKALAGRGAAVVLACRDVAKADAAAGRIRATVPGADLSLVELDLASLDSVRRAAEQLRAAHPRVDLLINNAGVMVPQDRTTADGQDLQIAVNHLGPFAFTGLVIDQLLGVPGSRVVTVSSNAHRPARIDFDALASGRRTKWNAYAQSKLANLLFTFELQRRLAAAGAGTVALAAHPGTAYTDLARGFPGWIRYAASPRFRWANGRLFHTAGQGALPTLRAATDPTAGGGDYFGPSGRLQFTGHPVRVAPAARARDAEAQRRLWRESERLTGIVYPL